ncbi:hypothetical protein FZC79_22565 [Rossellomorea vietnamensis]|uniref:Uncharacterized protein n=2 Tax=Rossellomorea TaxID=2837508 RepID=A0A5D4K6Y5_9BACI|nr:MULTISPECIES: hypothetical protein [Rossellomorea]TYR72480.1 hypothetical protein FZC79_22565 [Rossellomorea vietnamensis]TYS76605.1 hypothetical protein FZC80_14980 [Rossellomorea aquimaris]
MIIFILCVIPLLNGCRVVWVDESKDEKFEHNPDKEITLDTNVKLYRNKLLIRSESNLPVGTTLEFHLKPYQDDVDTIKFENYDLEPQDEVSASGTSKIREDGKMESIFVSRPDEGKRYRLEVVFDPRNQSKDVQERFGTRGELMVFSKGVTTVAEGSEKVTIIKKVVNIKKVGEPNGIGAKLSLASLKELKEANFLEKIQLTTSSK